MQMGLQVLQIEVQKGLLLMMIRRISLVRKPAAATKSPAKKPTVRTLKAKLLPPVVTLKHLAAEIAEAHEVPKTRAETMLTDTVDRLARHLVKGNKVRIVGLGIFQVKRREAQDGPQSADWGSGEDQGQQEGHLPRRQGVEGSRLTRGQIASASPVRPPPTPAGSELRTAHSLRPSSWPHYVRAMSSRCPSEAVGRWMRAVVH